ncbi:PLP-dependent transferase [Aureobasidium pullulans]|uniref:PLP-dependent transferase n=1 Tax=Aureobasidium pullulans TaxID=5580 RepID=A0A4S9Y7X9_AURPU|nr:PLP-dependent transferase [Aureobasidium pullulans]
MEAAGSTPPSDLPVLPSISQLDLARSSLRRELVPALGFAGTQQHLTHVIAPALNGNSQSSRYYGFVTGGATPAAVFADKMVTDYDQNVQVHLPNETVATDVEAAALDLVCQLVELDPKEWTHRTFTTGATSSNINGLACGREYVISTAAARNNTKADVSSLGLMAAMRVAGIDDIQILTSAPHSSLRKAASVLGLGHNSVKDVSDPTAPHRLDLEALENALQSPRAASIIAISCSEVNSGLFATTGKDMVQLRRLADEYGAWLHVDAAFGLLARILPSDEPAYAQLKEGVESLQLADSIAADAHKLFNVPYDCGILLSRHLDVGTAVFQNPGAPYLNAAAGSVPSPLNIGIENSRRFRALPVYANLVAYGRSGFVNMLENQIALARGIASYIQSSSVYKLLPEAESGSVDPLSRVFIIVLFKAINSELNDTLVKKINATRKIYVSGTKHAGQPACRFAISNWQASVEKDLAVIIDVLETVSSGHNKQ